ncbi:IS3 family transposase [Streptomyces sp. NPDC055103]
MDTAPGRSRLPGAGAVPVDVLRPQEAAEVGPSAPGRTAHALIEEIHAESGGTYGARRITRALGRKGVEVARCTVERLMAELGLEALRGRHPEGMPSAPTNGRGIRLGSPDRFDVGFSASHVSRIRGQERLWAVAPKALRRIRHVRRLVPTVADLVQPGRQHGGAA